MKLLKGTLAGLLGGLVIALLIFLYGGATWAGVIILAKYFKVYLPESGFISFVLVTCVFFGILTSVAFTIGENNGQEEEKETFS